MNGLDALDGGGVIPETRRCGAEDAALWSAYVETREDATVYHSLAWRDLLEGTYGFGPQYLMAEQGGTVAGLLPLFLVSNLAGRRLMSLPLSMYGGALCQDEATFQALLEGARALGVAADAPVSVRSWHEQDVQGYHRVQEETDFVVTVTEGGETAHFDKRLKPAARRAIRKAERSGLRVRQGGVELVPVFHGLLLRARRAQGLPCPGRRYLARLLADIPGGIFCCTWEGETLGGLLYLDDGRSVYYAFAASLEKGRILRAADLLLWELLRYTYSEGRRQLYLGGAMPDQEGLLQFKRKWGGEERPMFSYRTRPDERHGRTKRSGIPLYRHLPLWAARGLGPLAIRWFY